MSLAIAHDPRVEIWGMIAEFEHAEDLCVAAEKAYAAGYRRMDAYSPLPVEGLSDRLGFRDHLVPWIMFIGGCIGGIFGFGLLNWTTMLAYPLNIGGRPLFAWPSWIPITFECIVLFAALA